MTEYIRSFLVGNDDGDTEDDSYHVRVLRAYYKEEKRQLPSFIPADPRAPVRAVPVQMVSSSNTSLSSYAPSSRQSETRSLRSTNGIAQTGRPEASSSPSFIDSIPRGSQPVVAAAAPAAPLSQSARLKAQLGRTRAGSPSPSQNVAGGTAVPSLRSASPYEAPSAARIDNRPVAGGNYGRDQYSARPAAAPAAPVASANAPWSGGGDDYNGFSSYGSSSPFGDSGRNGGGIGRQGLPTGPRSGLVRGPRGMQT